MVNRNLLLSYIVKNNFTQKTFANKIGISENTLSSTMKGKRSPRLEEIDRMCEVLRISDIEVKAAIFLNNPSQ